MQSDKQTHKIDMTKAGAELAHAYTDGRIVGDALVQCFRPEGLEHIEGLPDYMGMIADAINQQPDDRTGSACLHGVVSSFVKELIYLNKKAFNQAAELRHLKGEIQ
jgi:hypothetical protein